MITGDEEETAEEVRVSGMLHLHQVLVLVGINPDFFFFFQHI